MQSGDIHAVAKRNVSGSLRPSSKNAQGPAAFRGGAGPASRRSLRGAPSTDPLQRPATGPAWPCDREDLPRLRCPRRSHSHRPTIPANAIVCTRGHDFGLHSRMERTTADVNIHPQEKNPNSFAGPRDQDVRQPFPCAVEVEQVIPPVDANYTVFVRYAREGFRSGRRRRGARGGRPGRLGAEPRRPLQSRGTEQGHLENSGLRGRRRVSHMNSAPAADAQEAGTQAAAPTGLGRAGVHVSSATRGGNSAYETFTGRPFGVVQRRRIQQDAHRQTVASASCSKPWVSRIPRQT